MSDMYRSECSVHVCVCVRERGECSVCVCVCVRERESVVYMCA